MNPILAAATPGAWLEQAARRWRELLIDHANCEKKAASTALAMIFAYPEDTALCAQLARLAREELRHFEQVLRLMAEQDIRFERQRPGRYGQALHGLCRSAPGQRKLDLLLVAALIEARSCERFAALAPLLAGELRTFYEDLQRSEARHWRLYLDLALARYEEVQVRARLADLAASEAALITSRDTLFRFHSGLPEFADSVDPRQCAQPVA
ncbi:MAG: tRNA-(ms[2]io[6]A)-hydroxylase [Steroidobacteraceae bacterium]